MVAVILHLFRRHIWPIVIGAIPFAAFEVMYIANSDRHYLTYAVAYFLLIYVIFTIYMVFAIKQYRRWLRDNYADLENKEVWLSHVLILVFLLLMIIYEFDGSNLTISYLARIISLALYGFLLWRVETMPLLENVEFEEQPEQSEQPEKQPVAIPSNIEQLLNEHCVDTQLYLQHDLTLLQLAQIIGTNRYYLSLYFSQQGITYNVYINNLRINHFMSLYREAAAANQNITAQQLASDSGFRSYSTFSLAFKQRMGQSVSAWMKDMP